MFFCVAPIDAKAEEYDYEAGFAFYTYVPGEYRRLSQWMMALQDGEVEQITDLTTLKTGDYVAIATTLKTIGTGKDRKSVV